MRFLRQLWYSRLRRDTVLLFALQTLYRLSGAVIVIVLSRSLPAEDIGRYYFALSFAEVFIVVASFRLQPVLMRRVAAQPAHASSHFAALLGFLLSSSPLYLLLVGGAALTFTPTVGWLIVLVSVFTLLEQNYLFCSHLFLALRKVVYGVGIGAAVQVVFLAVFLAGMWWRPALDVLVGANLFRALCLLGAGLFVIHRWLFPLRIGWDQSFIKEGTPFILLALLAILRNHLDTLLIGFFLDYAMVGQYNLALRIVTTTYFVPQVVSQVCFPQFAAHGLYGENRRLFIRGATFLLSLALCGVAGVFIGADLLTQLLYGALADAVAPLLRVCILLLPLRFCLFFLTSALQAMHQEAKVLRASAISTGISISANGILIPLFGVYGAICARLLSAVAELVMVGWAVFDLFVHPKPLPVQRPQSEEFSLPVAKLE